MTIKNPSQIIELADNARAILSCADLKDIDSYLFGVTKELQGFTTALNICQRAGGSEAANAIINSNGFDELIKEVRFVFKKIEKDGALKRLLHDRIVKVLKIPDAFDEADRGRQASNFVQEINRVNMQFETLDLRDTGVGDLPDQRSSRLDEERFKNAAESIRGLKGRLITAQAR